MWMRLLAYLAAVSLSAAQPVPAQLKVVTTIPDLADIVSVGALAA